MGLGRRTFAPGEVLTATNVMGYLQDQAVMNFAGSAARGSAIGTALQEGMASYLNDVDRFEVYNGTTWAPLAYGSAVTAAETRITSLEGTRPGTSGKALQFAAGSVTTSASADVTVTLPSGRFNVAPIITVTSVGGVNAVTTPYIATSGTANFTVSLYNTAGARVAQNVHWHAVQMTSGTASG